MYKTADPRTTLSPIATAAARRDYRAGTMRKPMNIQRKCVVAPIAVRLVMANRALCSFLISDYLFHLCVDYG